MIRLLLLIFFACCAFIGTQAVPAYPYRTRIVTADDSFYLILRGDENCKFAITDDGYTALQDSEGWFYAYENDDGEIAKSKYKVCSKERMKETTKIFLSTIEKGLQPSYYMDNGDSKQEYRSSMCRSGFSKVPVIGNMRVLIILMQYNDVKFKKNKDDFNRLFNETDYIEDSAYGSVYDFYHKVSYGQLSLKSDIIGPYTAKKDMSYYGRNSSRTGGDTNPKELFDEAIQFAIQDVNLSDYDSNGDGYVDNVHIIFAGYGEEAGASSDAIWSHEMTFRAENIDGMLIDHYSCSPELRGNTGTGITRIGPVCHEIGHALGAMDYYDTDYQSGGYYEGTGEWDIMASGSWNDEGARPADFNPYVKAYDYGWVDVQTLKPDTINIINPSTGRNNIYRIDTPVNGDYYLLDNRQSEGINSAEPGKGLLIFHIGPQISYKASTNSINATYPQQCYIVCASAKDRCPKASSYSYGNISSSGCPYPGTSQKSAFTNATIPASYCVNGRDAEVSLTDIVQLSDGSISLYYSKNSSGGDVEPDEPGKEEDMDIVWSEDFEFINSMSLQKRGWEIECLKGNSTWEAKPYSITPSDKDPEVVSGYMYMAMSSSKTGMLGESSDCCCRMTTKEIRLVVGEYVLTGQYGGYYDGKITNDKLEIEILPNDDNNHRITKSLRINKQTEWSLFSIPISCSKDITLELTFTGNIDSKSILFLDDLKIHKQSASHINRNAMVKDEACEIFSPSGERIKMPHNGCQGLPSGIYIVRNGNHTRKLMITK